jgi:hypothetical protein
MVCGYVVSSDAILLVEHRLAGSILNFYRFDSLGRYLRSLWVHTISFRNLWDSYYLQYLGLLLRHGHFPENFGDERKKSTKTSPEMNESTVQ